MQHKTVAVMLAVVLAVMNPARAEDPAPVLSAPSAPVLRQPASQAAVNPEDVVTPIAFQTVLTGSQADHLEVTLAVARDPKKVGQYFDRKLWRKRFVPFYLTLENKGQYPIEVSTGNILILEEKDLPSKKKSSRNQGAAATPPVSRTSKSRSKKKKELPPFVAPTPPGIVFSKSKHLQYGWKGNLSMVLLTGATLGFAAPITVPAMVAGNVHRGTNKRLAANFQDQSLSRLILEPGDKTAAWLFYRRDRKKQLLLPKKVVFADIYTPAREELSSFTIDLQPIKTSQPALRRAMEASEIKDLQLFQGKIVAEVKNEQTAERMQDLEDLGGQGMPEVLQTGDTGP